MASARWSSAGLGDLPRDVVVGRLDDQVGVDALGLQLLDLLLELLAAVDLVGQHRHACRASTEEPLVTVKRDQAAARLQEPQGLRERAVGKGRRIGRPKHDFEHTGASFP